MIKKESLVKLVLVVCTIFLNLNLFGKVITLNIDNGNSDGNLYEQNENVEIGDVIRFVNNLNYTITNTQGESTIVGDMELTIAPGEFHELVINSTEVDEIFFIHDNFNVGKVYNNVINLNFSLSVNDLDNAKLKTEIYPNPCLDFLKITSNKPIKSVELFDVTGKLLFTTKFSSNQLDRSINMSSYPVGKYILRVTNDSSVNTLSVIKK